MDKSFIETVSELFVQYKVPIMYAKELKNKIIAEHNRIIAELEENYKI